MKAVFLDWATMGPDLDTGQLRALLPELDVFDITEDDEVAARIQDAAFVLTNKIRLTDELLNRCPELRFIGLTATGTDNVNLETAAKHGVAVCNIRAYCTQSVAEHVFGCLLSLTHSLGRYAADVRAGEWQKSDNFCLLTHPVRELSAMTLGIVGYGELGKGVAKTGAAFGMEVIISIRPGTSENRHDRVSFDELLARSDVISLLPKEPPVRGDPLLDYEGDNLIVTPHIAWATNEARQAAVDELAANIAAFMDGRQRNRVV